MKHLLHKIKHLGAPLALITLLLLPGLGWGLSAGDIAIIAVNTDASKTMTFVALSEIPANTSVSFTDNAWDATNQVWRTGEGTIVWSHTSSVAAGTVITLSVNADPYSSTTGTVTTNTNFNLSTSGDQILAYEGTTAPTTNIATSWLYGFSTESWVWGNSSNTSDIPTALTGAYVGMTSSTTETDNAYFANGSAAQTAVTVSGTKAELLALFNDASKYYKDNAGPLTIPTYTITVNTGATAPTVTTEAATSLAATSATFNGTITSDGGSSITERGFCYNTTGSVAITDNKTSESGTATGAFSKSFSSLSVNTQYFYRAYATNAIGTTLGSTDVSFYTLANMPAAPVVDNATTTSLDIAIGGSDGNPAATTYAIHESTTDNFVQSDGTLGASTVWQTATAWGTKTVTGLTGGTSYTFEVKARNGANTETTYGTSTSLSTLAVPQIDWCNVQWPLSGNITLGDAFIVYAQVYEPGVTNSGGQGAGITAWIGYGTSNTDLSEYTWVLATYNGDAGNNDEYSANIGADLLASGNYYYASRFQLGSAPFVYGGTSGIWSSGQSGPLTVSQPITWANLQSPASGSINVGGDYNVYARVYKSGVTEAAGQGADITAWIGYHTSDTDPSTWTNWVSATYNTDAGNNDEYMANIGTSLAAGTYYYASRFQYKNYTSDMVYGGYSESGGGLWDGTTYVSGVLTVTTPEPPSHATGFSATAASYNSITVSWTDASGASGYLIKGSSDSYAAITAPVDGTAETDGSLVKNIAAGIQTYQFTGLTASTTYYFKIYPYNGTGSAVNYKTDETVPEANATTSETPTLWLVEDFDYADGALLTANGWSAHSAAGTQAIDVTVPGLTFDGYVGSGIGGAARLDNNGEDVNKTFTPQTSGSIYAAFMISASSTNSAGYFFHLAQENISTSTFISRVWVNGNGTGIGIGSSAPDPYVTISANTPTLLVVKYNIDTKLSSLYVLNTMSATEPVTADATFTETATLTNVGAVCLRQYNASQNILVDGIRVTTSWTDLVMPTSTTWDGSASNDWNNSENWSAGIPSSGMDVVIPYTGITNFPTLSAAGTCKNITIESGASLIDNGYLTVTGTATVERYIEAATWATAGSGWHLLSSPVAAQGISGTWTPIGEGNDYDFYAFDETATTEYWLNQKVGANNITTFIPGKGYLVAYQQTGTKTFSGTLNAADVTLSGLTNTSGSAYPGWHLVGNPFASAVDYDLGTWAKTNIDQEIQVWNSTEGSYKTSTEVGGIIPAMNGFMVHTAGSGSITVPADARVHNAANWYKSDEEFILLKANDLDGQTSQSSIVRFNPSATEAYDADFDAYFLSGFAPMFYSVSGSSLYALNTLPAVSNELAIPFGFVKNSATNYSIELAKNIPATIVYLTDIKTGTVTNLTDNSVYHFTAAEGDDANRFTLHFGTLGMDDPSTAAPVNIYAYSGVVYLNGLDATASVTITDLTGRVVMAERVNGNGLSMINAGNLPKGVYVVTAVSGSRVVSAKVIL